MIAFAKKYKYSNNLHPLKEQCGIQPIGEWVNKRREDWNNHLKNDRRQKCQGCNGQLPKR
jgi:hypothetical protein